uniref:Uncharacterized protein n=1 Tax=Chloropicon primus TaxID=1764295 RepID=A0A7S2X1K4_9CHLO
MRIIPFLRLNSLPKRMRMAATETKLQSSQASPALPCHTLLLAPVPRGGWDVSTWMSGLQAASEAFLTLVSLLIALAPTEQLRELRHSQFLHPSVFFAHISLYSGH